VGRYLVRLVLMTSAAGARARMGIGIGNGISMMRSMTKDGGGEERFEVAG
jgi:hypothetical protein